MHYLCSYVSIGSQVSDAFKMPLYERPLRDKKFLFCFPQAALPPHTHTKRSLK